MQALVSRDIKPADDLPMMFLWIFRLTMQTDSVLACGLVRFLSLWLSSYQRTNRSISFKFIFRTGQTCVLFLRLKLLVQSTYRVLIDRYSFMTRKWDADEKTDKDHWVIPSWLTHESKFPSFERFLRCLYNDKFTYDFENEDFIYMRWKVKSLEFIGIRNIF